MPTSPDVETGTLLLIGVSRGLGLAIASEFLKLGWRVVATARGGDTPLHRLAITHPERLQIELLDITDQDQIAALGNRLVGRRFEALFVNAGIANANQDETIAEVSTGEFVQLMVTNALRCGLNQVHQMIAAARLTAERKFLASLSYLVAMRRQSFRRQNMRSTRFLRL